MLCSGWPLAMTDFSESVAVGCCLHAGAAGDAFGGEERVVLARHHLEAKPRPSIVNARVPCCHRRQAARSASTRCISARIEGEIGVGFILLGLQVIGAGIAIAHATQADGSGHILQLAVPIGRAGEAIERVVGDVEFHDTAPQLRQAAVLGRHAYARGHGRGTGGRIALQAIDLHQAQAARSEGFELIGRAQFRDRQARERSRAQYGGASRNAHRAPIDGEVGICCCTSVPACRDRLLRSTA